MPDASETYLGAPTNEAYLGDGLYASCDGWSITLRAPREHGDHFVALEPKVVAALVAFMKLHGWKDES